MRVQLKKWEGDVGSQLEDLYEQVDQSKCLVTLSIPLSKEKLENFIQAIQQEVVEGKAFQSFAIWVEEEMIGKIELTRYENRTSELDLVIKEAYCGKGYGTEAVKLLLQFVQAENWCTSIHAYVDESNQEVIHMLWKNGFQKGRSFQADISMEQEGTYYFQVKKGVEMIWNLTLPRS